MEFLLNGKMGNCWAFLLVLAILHNPVFAREPKTSNAPFLTPCLLYTSDAADE